MTTPSLLLATTNPAKVPMLRRLVGGLGFQLIAGPDTSVPPTINEDDTTHLAIAVHKAVAWSRLHSMPVVASDGGVAIPALGNAWESRMTRRHTGEGDVPDETRARRLLGMMKGLEGEGRAVHRVEAAAIAQNGALLGAWEAAGFHGFVALGPASHLGGTKGAWVESVLVAQDGRRYWELSPADFESFDEPWAVLALPVRGLLKRLAPEGDSERASG